MKAAKNATDIYEMLIRGTSINIYQTAVSYPEDNALHRILKFNVVKGL
jgi:hypothetical protein